MVVDYSLELHFVDNTDYYYHHYYKVELVRNLYYKVVVLKMRYVFFDEMLNHPKVLRELKILQRYRRQYLKDR